MFEFMDKPAVRRIAPFGAIAVGSLIALGIQYGIIERNPTILRQSLDLDNQTLAEIEDAKTQITKTGHYNGTTVKNPEAVMREFSSREDMIRKDIQRINKIFRKNAALH